MKLVLRGAIQVKEDNKDSITESVQKLYRALINQNRIKNNEINYVLLSQTKDLTSYNSATAVRLALKDEEPFPLFCCQEAYIERSMEKVVRIMIVTDRDIKNRKEAIHLYLDGTQALRPDLSIKSETSN